MELDALIHINKTRTHIRVHENRIRRRQIQLNNRDYRFSKIFLLFLMMNYDIRTYIEYIYICIFDTCMLIERSILQNRLLYIFYSRPYFCIIYIYFFIINIYIYIIIMEYYNNEMKVEMK